MIFTTETFFRFQNYGSEIINGFGYTKFEITEHFFSAIAVITKKKNHQLTLFFSRFKKINFFRTLKNNGTLSKTNQTNSMGIQKQLMQGWFSFPILSMVFGSEITEVLQTLVNTESKYL